MAAPGSDPRPKNRLITGKPCLSYRPDIRATPWEGQELIQPTQIAYIAGFLDGDGSIIMQLKPRKDYVYGFQIKATVSFFQRRENRCVLEYIQSLLGVGAIRNRPDGISEYNIEGLEPAKQVLELVRPYVILKRQLLVQAPSIIDELLNDPKPSPTKFLELAKRVERCQALNYSKKGKHTSEDVGRFLSSKGLLAPVTTED